MPCTCRSQRGTPGKSSPCCSSARFAVTREGASPQRSPRLNRSNGGSDSPAGPRRVVNACTPHGAGQSAVTRLARTSRAAAFATDVQCGRERLARRRCAASGHRRSIEQRGLSPGGRLHANEVSGAGCFEPISSHAVPAAGGNRHASKAPGGPGQRRRATGVPPTAASDVKCSGGWCVRRSRVACRSVCARKRSRSGSGTAERPSRAPTAKRSRRSRSIGAPDGAARTGVPASAGYCRRIGRADRENSLFGAGRVRAMTGARGVLVESGTMPASGIAARSGRNSRRYAAARRIPPEHDNQVAC